MSQARRGGKTKHPSPVRASTEKSPIYQQSSSEWTTGLQLRAQTAALRWQIGTRPIHVAIPEKRHQGPSTAARYASVEIALSVWRINLRLITRKMGPRTQAHRDTHPYSSSPTGNTTRPESPSSPLQTHIDLGVGPNNHSDSPSTS